MNTIFSIEGKNESFPGTGQKAIKNLTNKYPQYKTMVAKLLRPIILVGFTDDKGNRLPDPDLRPHWERKTNKKP